MVILKSGYVGIGASTPAYKLEIITDLKALHTIN